MIFVPCTPGGKLMKAYQEQIKKSEFKIKVVEQSGSKLHKTYCTREIHSRKKAVDEKTALCAQREEQEIVGEKTLPT